ncbi:MAG: hypothetical protein JWM33_3521 [Caulobacteraceae bacterium]|nr:hypothetical protein [Caulobacteraceae bacterium]
MSNSLRSDLEAAYAAETGEAIEPRETPAEAAAPQFEEDSVDAATPPTETTTRERAEPETQTLRAPNAWTATAKAAFAALPPQIQSEVIRREKEMEAGKAQWDAKASHYNRFSELVAPYKERWAVQGVDELSAIRQLLAASDWLERDPSAALTHLARQYGIHPQALQPAQAQQANEPQLPDALQPILQELQTLKQQVEGQQRGAQEARTAELIGQIDAFEQDHLYFSNVREDMAVLLESGRASNLADAYEMACWLHPEVRPLKMAQASQASNAAQKLARARHAGGSVTGSPPAAGAALGAQPNNTRDALMAAWDEAEARV